MRVSVGSLTYSPLYGNKVRKLWKVLAKNNELSDASYDFLIPHKCKVVECKDTFATAMDMFRHVREAHLCTVKKLKIKIGTPPASPSKFVKRSNRPGPRSKTMVQSTNHFPFPVSYLGSSGSGSATPRENINSSQNTFSRVNSFSKINIDHESSSSEVDTNNFIDESYAIAASEAVMNTTYSNEPTPNTSLNSSMNDDYKLPVDESMDESVDDENIDSSFNSSAADISYDASSNSAFGDTVT